MMNFLIIAIIIIIIIDGIPLYKKKQWKELTVFAVIIVFACFFFISKNIGIPSPVSVINELLNEYGKKFFGKTM